MNYKEKLKQAVIDGKTSMYSRELTDIEKIIFKQKMLKLYS